jgi:hypothetical protein
VAERICGPPGLGDTTFQVPGVAALANSGGPPPSPLDHAVFDVLS